MLAVGLDGSLRSNLHEILIFGFSIRRANLFWHRAQIRFFNHRREFIMVGILTWFFGLTKQATYSGKLRDCVRGPIT